MNVLRTVFEIKFVTQNTQQGTLSVARPINVLEPATRFLRARLFAPGSHARRARV